jgi:signal transduction histidine kinase
VKASKKARLSTMTASYQKRFTPPTTAVVDSSAVICALRAASENAARRIVASDANALNEMHNEMALLAETVYTLASDRNNSHIGPRALAFSRQVVDAFRTEFLEHLKRDTVRRVDSRELLVVMLTLDELSNVKQRSSGEFKRTSGEFEERLASSDAMQAVLEVAHDMRSPLGAILFLVETLRSGQSGTITPVQERQLGLIYGAAFGLSTLSNDIMEAARGNLLSDGGPRPFSVSDILQDVCAIVAPMAEEKRLELRKTYPKVDGRAGNASALHRVLLNLASNAVKYTNQGWVALGCTELENSKIEFWIEDTGRGIPDQVLSMLFAGFRPGSSGMRFSSAGLGLAICRSLLEAMNSTLRVDTVPEEGTRFSFVLELPPAS